MLTRILREQGAQNACLSTDPNMTEEKALELARQFPGIKGMDLAKVVRPRKFTLGLKVLGN